MSPWNFLTKKKQAKKTIQVIMTVNSFDLGSMVPIEREGIKEPESGGRSYILVVAYFSKSSTRSYSAARLASSSAGSGY